MMTTKGGKKGGKNNNQPHMQGTKMQMMEEGLDEETGFHPVCYNVLPDHCANLLFLSVIP